MLVSYLDGVLSYCGHFIHVRITVIISVAPIIGSAIGYRPIIDVVLHIGISGTLPYRFFTFFFLLRCIFQA